MTRSVHALLALVTVVGASVAGIGCNSPNCGKGTKQVQQADGTLVCEQSDYPAPLIQCDVDGGMAEIVGGKCVSHVKCDPNTTGYDPVTGICVGIGGGPPSACPACTQPGSGKICLTGNVYDFSTGAQVKQHDRTTRIGAYEPLAFLADSTVAPIRETVDDNGCYTFADLVTPGSGQVAVAIADPKGVAQTLAFSGAATVVVSGQIYKLDIYLLPKTVVDTWSTQTGKNWDATGGYIALYYDQPVQDLTNQRIDANTKPVAGVKIVESNTVVAAANYFDPSSTMLSTTLTATGAFGGAMVAGTGNIVNYGGLPGSGTCAGGPCKWEQHLGGSPAHAFVIAQFFNCALSPTAATCQ